MQQLIETWKCLWKTLYTAKTEFLKITSRQHLAIIIQHSLNSWALFSVRMIAHCFSNTEVRLWGGPSMTDPLCVSIQVCFHCNASVFGSLSGWKINLLPIRCFPNCMTDGYTTVGNAAQTITEALTWDLHQKLNNLAYPSLFSLIPFLKNGFLLSLSFFIV